MELFLPSTTPLGIILRTHEQQTLIEQHRYSIDNSERHLHPKSWPTKDRPSTTLAPYNPESDPAASALEAADEPNDPHKGKAPAFNEEEVLQKANRTDKRWYKETYKNYGENVTANNLSTISKASESGSNVQDWAGPQGQNEPGSKIDAPDDWVDHAGKKGPKPGRFERHTHAGVDAGYDPSKTTRDQYSGNVGCPSSRGMT